MTQEIFNEWLENIIKTERPVPEVIAYYFGIFKSDEGYQTYLIGSKEFDINDSDWACNQDFEPKNKYLTLGQEEIHWESILAQVKSLVINFTQTNTFKNSFLERAQAIAIGFDDGDLFLIEK